MPNIDKDKNKINIDKEINNGKRKSKNQLTESQSLAVEQIKGEFVVKAGAGTGKTTVLINKYINIYNKGIESGKDPVEVCSSILTVTFTKKAAKEMRDRLSKSIPKDIMRNANMSTIDAFCSKFLKEHSIYLNWDPDFKVLDEIESKLIFRKIAIRVLEEEMKEPLDIDMSRNQFINETYQLVSHLKQLLIEPDDFKSYKKDNPDTHDAVYQMYKNYEEYLETENLLDFSKLLISTYKIMKNDTEVRKKIQDKFKYVMIDEYQDTNPAQIKLLRLIAEPQNNYFAVGDEKQSIYGFRGAEPKHIIDFYKESPKTSKVVLKNNFRSFTPIPEVVNAVFKEVIDDYEPIETTIGGKASVDLYLGDSRLEEAKYIASKVLEFLNGGYEPHDIVVLFRGVKNCQLYEDALREVRIPTLTIGGMGFYQQPEIKDIISILSVIENPQSERELVRFIRSPAISMNDSEIAELASQKEKGETLYDALHASKSEKAMKTLKLINDFRKKRFKMTLTELIYDILEESGLMYWAVSKTGGRGSRQMSNIQKFIQNTRKFISKNVFSTLADFIEYLKQLEDAEIVEPEARPRAKGVVNLMSIHQAKGLEFPVVFVSNIATQNFPAGKQTENLHYLKGQGLILKSDDKNSKFEQTIKGRLYKMHDQEENRLLYVAMTRAMKHLVLSGFKSSRGKMSKFMEYFLEPEATSEASNKVLKSPFRNMIQVDSIKEIKGIKAIREKKDSFEEKKEEFKYISQNLGLPFFSKKTSLKNEFTVTELETYSICPMKYNFRYRLNIPEPPPKTAYSAGLMGTAVHRMLQEYYGEKQSMNEQKMKENIVMYLINNGVSQTDYNELYRDSTEVILKNLNSMNILRPADEVKFIEKPFVLAYRKAYIKGTIDRVDVFNNNIELIDYKTSAADNIGPYAIQVGIYNKALEEIFGLRPTKTLLVFLKKKSIRDVPVENTIDIKLTSLINGIQNSIFYKNCSTGCSTCSYSVLCSESE